MNIIEFCKELFGIGEFSADRLGGAMRNDGWSKASRDFIKEEGGLCKMGLHKPTIFNPLNTHHVVPFNEAPHLEMVKTNWIILCRLHHFIHGHLKNWSSSNPNILQDCEALNLRIAKRP